MDKMVLKRMHTQSEIIDIRRIARRDVCGKLGHLSKDCFHRKDKSGQGFSENSRQNKKDYNNSGNLNKNTNYVSNDKVDYCTFHAFIANQCPRLESNK